MNVEDDLWSRWRPLQVASDSNPQLVDVRVFPVIRGDRQRVGDGKQLEGHDEVNIQFTVVRCKCLCFGLQGDAVPSEEHLVLGPASRALKLQGAACLQTA